ncbi:MAG: hypothetical protein LBI33_05135 [Propionibacteriaceae bacterium]|jgi:hypothetical protein|nr:hypothetical protein [Propionibacteriaceae bacterium]
MRVKHVVGEAFRNCLSATARVVPLVLIWVVIMGGTCGLDLVELGVLDTQIRDFHDSGGATVVLSAAGSVDGHQCDDLARIDGVEAAGAIRVSDDRVDVPQTPYSPLPLSEVSSGFATLLTFRGGGTGGTLMASTALADQYVTANHLATLGHGDLPVSGVYEWPKDGRADGLGYTLIAETPSDHPFDQCWMTVWPPNNQTTDLITLSLVPGTPPGSAVVTQLNPARGSTLDPPQLYANRPTKWLPVAGTALIGIVAFAAIRLRRLELASALHCGVPRVGLLLQTQIETAWWTVTGTCLVGGALVILGVLLDEPDPGAYALAAGWPLGLALLTASLGTGLGTLATRERSLMRYFRNR